jgi:alpha-galactosidase
MFDVCMAGVLGVGNDITLWNDAEKETARKKIAQYKEIREITHRGDAYRLISPYGETNRSVLQYVSKDKKNAVVFNYRLAEYPDNTTWATENSPLVKLRGLQPDAQYKIDDFKDTYSGAYLMEVGIRFPLKGAFKSYIYTLKMEPK